MRQENFEPGAPNEPTNKGCACLLQLGFGVDLTITAADIIYMADYFRRTIPQEGLLDAIYEIPVVVPAVAFVGIISTILLYAAMTEPEYGTPPSETDHDTPASTNKSPKVYPRPPLRSRRGSDPRDQEGPRDKYGG